MDTPCALECSQSLSTHLATIRITIYIVRKQLGTPPALQCALQSLPIRACITAPIGRARRPAARARQCVREQRVACWPSSSLIERAPKYELASKSLAEAEPPASAAITDAARKPRPGRARPAYACARTIFNTPVVSRAAFQQQRLACRPAAQLAARIV